MSLRSKFSDNRVIKQVALDCDRHSCRSKRCFHSVCLKLCNDRPSLLEQGVHGTFLLVKISWFGSEVFCEPLKQTFIGNLRGRAIVALDGLDK